MGYQLPGLDFLCIFLVENLENLEKLTEENSNHLEFCLVQKAFRNFNVFPSDLLSMHDFIRLASRVFLILLFYLFYYEGFPELLNNPH